MFIHEAIRGVSEQHPYIRRAAWRENNSFEGWMIKLTATGHIADPIVIIGSTGMRPGFWNPVKGDLLADDWENSA